MPKLDSLKPYVTYQEPFGPIDSTLIGPDYEALRLLLLFERRSQAYKKRPSIIMGRRGAGKTSYLKSVYFQDQYQYYVEIPTPKIVQYISEAIQNDGKKNFVEIVMELWEKTLLICVFVEICKSDFPASKNLDIIIEYLKRIDIQRNASVHDILSRLDTMYRETIVHNPQNGISEIIKKFGSANFEGAKSAAIECLGAVKAKFVILMDSLEEFHVGDESTEHAIKGLLKLAGFMNAPKDVIDIRLCLTTELKPIFFRISSNPNKDFAHMDQLEWTLTDLILIGAQRLMYFLKLHYQDLIIGISPSEELNRASAFALFRKVLPEKIINQNGYEEVAISYILRHMQLLPRHFIMLLNSIFRSAFARHEKDPFPVTGEDILSGVRQVEESIVQEIFTTFNVLHPDARELCKRCLPQLPKTFKLGDLHHVLNRHGKKHFPGGEFTDFYRMLVEIGVIGRVSYKSDLYITGKFQYMIGHELNLSYDDDLCVHPLFSGIYGRAGNEDQRPVYPEGNNLDNN
ncbi:MAG: hypothetical protein KGZ85_07270 [Ignavibacterium sp.]|nr:hypothetical protein [Ignavibacterium sp.]